MGAAKLRGCQMESYHKIEGRLVVHIRVQPNSSGRNGDDKLGLGEPELMVPVLSRRNVYLPGARNVGSARHELPPCMQLVGGRGRGTSGRGAGRRGRERRR